MNEYDNLLLNEEENNNNGNNNNKNKPKNNIPKNQKDEFDQNGNLKIDENKKDKKAKEQPNNNIEEDANKKKNKDQEPLVIASNPNNQLISNAKEEVQPEKKTAVEEKLAEVSNGSGVNLKAYFVEENGKEIDEISKGNLGYKNFKFNGNMKDFYSKVYRHVLESNLIARQLADEKEREELPTFKELAEKFEEFMKTTGEELVKRGHLDKYEPFGGLSANELKAIENSCLLNRPKTEKEAALRTASSVSGKTFDEQVENGYRKAEDTISNLGGADYKKGDNPNKDRIYLQTSANLIKGMSMLRDKEKIWNTYLPDLSAPKWNKPIHKHLLSNAFRAVKRGVGIVVDSTIKFPLKNAMNAVKYPFNKLANVVSVAYNTRKLENLVYAKGFTKDELKNAINNSEKPPVNVEKDVNAIEDNFKNNQKKIEEYQKEKVNEKAPVTEERKHEFKDIKPVNEHKFEIEVPEADDRNLLTDIVPEIKDNNLVKEKQTIINN